MDGSCSLLRCSFSISGLVQVSCRAGVFFLHSLPQRELPGSSLSSGAAKKKKKKHPWHKREGGFVLVHGPSHTKRSGNWRGLTRRVPVEDGRA